MKLRIYGLVRTHNSKRAVIVSSNDVYVKRRMYQGYFDRYHANTTAYLSSYFNFHTSSLSVLKQFFPLKLDAG